MQRFETNFSQRKFHFAFDAAIKNRRSRIGTQRTHHQKLFHTRLPGRAREIEYERKIDFAKRGLRAGFLYRGAEAAIRVVCIRKRGQRIEIDHEF